MNNNSDTGNTSEAFLRCFMAFLETQVSHTNSSVENREDDPSWTEGTIPPFEAHRVCRGCEGFACVRVWPNMRYIPQGEAAEVWMKNHGLLSEPQCKRHGGEFMVGIKGSLQFFECTHRGEGDTSACRARVFRYAPYLRSRSSVALTTLLLIWADIANNLTTGQIARNRGVRQRAVTNLLHMVSSAAYFRQENVDFNFSKLQVDETFIGKRKCHRGKRVRKVGWWFVTVTEIDDRKMGRTHWKLVK